MCVYVRVRVCVTVSVRFSIHTVYKTLCIKPKLFSVDIANQTLS